MGSGNAAPPSRPLRVDDEADGPGPGHEVEVRGRDRQRQDVRGRQEDHREGPKDKDYTFDLDEAASINPSVAVGARVKVTYTKADNGQKITMIEPAPGRRLRQPTHDASISFEAAREGRLFAYEEGPEMTILRVALLTSASSRRWACSSFRWRSRSSSRGSSRSYSSYSFWPGSPRWIASRPERRRAAADRASGCASSRSASSSWVTLTGFVSTFRTPASSMRRVSASAVTPGQRDHDRGRGSVCVRRDSHTAPSPSGSVMSRITISGSERRARGRPPGGSRLRDAITLGLEQRREPVAGGVVVFDDQHARPAPAVRLWRSRAPASPPRAAPPEAREP